MKQKAVGIGLMAAMVLLLMMGCSVAGSEAVETGDMDADTSLYAQAESKAIGVRSGDASSDRDFQVSFQPLKDVYQTGERIRFRIRGNKTFYLYLFSIDERQNRGYLLFPNVKQSDNMYQANADYEVPAKEVEFYSDLPGTEKIVMVASTAKLDVKMEKYAKSGNLFRSEAKTMEQDVKALRIRSGDKKEQKVVQELTLVITGEGRRSENMPPPPPPAETGDRDRNPVSTFISSDKTDYRVGDIIKMTFGADRQGYVHLYTVEPDGRRTFLTKQAVSGREFYQVKVKALQPSGQHTIVAIYGEEENLSRDKVDMITLGQKSKRLELIGDRPDSYAVYQLNVYE